MSPVSALNITAFLAVGSKKQSYDLDSSPAHGGDFRGEDVVNAHGFLYVASTLVTRMGQFRKPLVVVCSPDSGKGPAGGPSH